MPSMTSLSDIPAGLTVHHASAFDLDDDAFSAGDEDKSPIAFSSVEIRNDVARAMANLERQESAPTTAMNGAEGGGQNASVSTLDINGDVKHSEAGSISSHAASSDDTHSSLDQFSQISLTSPQDEVEEVQAHISLQSTHSPSREEDLNAHGTPYPSVIIDAGPIHQVAIITHSLNDTTTNTSASCSHINISTQSLPGTNSHAQYPRDEAPPSSSSTPGPSHTPVEADSTPSPSPHAAQDPPPKPAPKPPAQDRKAHRPTRSTGPSALEKVRSKTRPPFLPPKNRQEDDKHMADWQAMMKQSRITAERHRKALQERRLAREAKIEASLHVWEREILPDWKVVHRNPSLRKLWWKGIPTKLRSSMWEKAVGNGLALSKDSYRTCLARAKRAMSAGVFPKASLEPMEKDILTTLPSLHIFHPERGPMYEDLKDLLCAWIVARSDEGMGYTIGAAKVAAMLLLNMQSPQAFVVMRNLLDRHCLRSFFGGDGTREDVEAYYRIFDTLLADGMPKVYFNFKQHQISPAAYLPNWLLPLFLDHLPFEACARVWDVLLLEGDAFLYRVSLGVLAVLEPRLFFPDKRELLELLRGENRAAIEVAKREGRALDGGKYEIYGLDEETLWERIDSMEDWWKESTWNRLIQRELPDI